MSKEVKIVFFYTVVVHYVIGLLRALKKVDPNIGLTVVFYDKKNINSSRYIVPSIDGINFIQRSVVDKQGLLDLLIKEDPSIIYISGWVDKDYIWAAKKYKRRNFDVKIVNGIDDQWFGSLRQHIGAYYFKFSYRKLFDYFWIAGKPQYQYAQKFGYNQQNIIYNLLSADETIFSTGSVVSQRFVFLGRFVTVKGIDLLLDAYNSLSEDVKSKWPLVLIGDGPLRDSIKANQDKNIQILPFLQPDELKNEIQKGGVLCLPSRFESWGLVIHELALNGYPLVVSSVCGAASEFLINGYNGYMFESGSVESLRNSLLNIISLSNENLSLFSLRSRMLGVRINSEISAYSLLSILKLK